MMNDAQDALIDDAVLMQLRRDVGDELIPMLVMAFVDECNRFHHVLIGLSLPEDSVEMMRVCHSLKSSCATYGALAASQLARSLETTCKSQQWPEAQQQQAELLLLLRASLAQLREVTNC